MMGDSRSDVLLGLDMGGTALKYGIVRTSGEVVFAAETAVEARLGRSAIVAALKSACSELMKRVSDARQSALAIGLGFPGTVGGKFGAVLTEPPQIPDVKGLRLGSLLERWTSLPATVENDASAATLAEALQGAGRGRRNLLMVTVGTGVGGGLVIDGNLVRGRFGTGGEIGHAVLVPHGLPCRCGGRGCVELYASATALVRIYRERGGNDRSSPRDIVERAKRGERRAGGALAEVGSNLGLAVASAATVVAPEVIVVGGGLVAAGPALLDPMRAAYVGQVFPHLRRTSIRKARLGNTAGFVGAALASGQQLGFLESRAH